MAIDNDSWQKKSVSQAIHEQGQQTVKKDSRQAAETIAKLHAAKISETPKQTQATNTSETKVQAPILNDVPQTVQKARAETQEQAARHDQQAAKQFQDARKDAQSLKSLESKPTARSGEAATREAVTQKGQALQPDLGKQNAKQTVPQSSQATAQTIQRDAAARNAALQAAAAQKAQKKQSGPAIAEPKVEAEKPADTKKGPQVASEPRDLKDAKAPAAPVVQSGEQPAKSDKTKESADGEKKTADKRKSSETKQAGGVHAGKAASKELGELLGGFGSSTSSGGNETDQSFSGSAVAEASARKPLPELDESFVAFNEIDSTKPGVEFVKSKAQLFSRHVEKKLGEIAQLDRELDGWIKGLGLSERVIGDLKEELSAADFLKSVYGGLIG